MAPHSSTLAWKIPWTEQPGRLRSMGWLRVRRDWATSLSLFTFMHWRMKWQPTPVFLPGESQGWGSLVGCRLRGCTESDTTEATQQQQQQQQPYIPNSLVSFQTQLWKETAVPVPLSPLEQTGGVGGAMLQSQTDPGLPVNPWAACCNPRPGPERLTKVLCLSFLNSDVEKGYPLDYL